MHKHSDNAAPTFLPDLLPSLLPLVVRATMPPSSREEDSARFVCAVYICVYVYVYVMLILIGRIEFFKGFVNLNEACA